MPKPCKALLKEYYLMDVKMWARVGGPEKAFGYQRFSSNGNVYRKTRYGEF